MSSLQERLLLKRSPVDTWNVREKLCLASAVARSGDQNWMSVSRALKTVGEANRPPDWYSQKSCAAQYGELLENVETPKRKKRNSDGAVETPQESILKTLTERRIQEIKNTIAEMNAQYEQIKNEVIEARDPATPDERIQEMWASIEAAKRARERETARRAAWLKEREERLARSERTWRPAQAPPPATGAPVTPSSPLLTSLLKSSPVVTTPQHIPHPASIVDAVSPSAGAPTLSLLLEGGAESKHAAIEHIKSQLVQIEHQLKDAVSPSAGAPTLSLLLEGGAESKHAAIEHIKSQLVQIEHQLKANSQPPAPPAVDIDDIEIKAEDVYAFRDIDIHIPPVATMHKTVARVIEKPVQKKETEITLPEPEVTETLVETTKDETVTEEDTSNEDIVVTEEMEVVEETPIQDPPPVEVRPPEPEVKISFPEVKFPTPEIKIIHPEQPKMQIKEEIREPEVKVVEEKITEQAEEVAAVKLEETAVPLEDNSVVIDDTIVIEEQPKTEEPTLQIPVTEQSQPEQEAPQPQEQPQLQTEQTQPQIEQPQPQIEQPQPQIEQPQPQIDQPQPQIEQPQPQTEQPQPEIEQPQPQLEVTVSEAPDPQDIPLPPEDEQEDLEVLEEIQLPPNPEQPITIGDNAENTDQPIQQPMKHETVSVDPVPEERVVEKVPEDVKKEEEVEKMDEDSIPLKDMIKEESQQQQVKPEREGIEEDAHTETDDDTPMEVSREEDKDGKKRRDYSRKRKSDSRTCSGSESAPDSPSNNDAEKQHRMWKKSVMLVYNRLCAHKFASLFLRPITDEEAPGYSVVVKRPMDLTAVRRNIDAGNIRTTAEFQRDVLLMLSNALLYNSSSHSVYRMAREMHEEAQLALGMLLAAQAHAGLCTAPLRRKRRLDPHHGVHKRAHM